MTWWHLALAWPLAGLALCLGWARSGIGVDDMAEECAAPSVCGNRNPSDKDPK